MQIQLKWEADYSYAMWEEKEVVGECKNTNHSRVGGIVGYFSTASSHVISNLKKKYFNKFQIIL